MAKLQYFDPKTNEWKTVGAPEQPPELPEVSAADNGKVLKVVGGVWAIGNDLTSDTDYENIARQNLTGKVMVCLGDSYTVGMANQLSALATKYGMIIDNRGYVGATICWRSSDPNRRIYNIADTVVSDYTTGKVIGDVTYTSDDVGLITFMGGANDYNAIANWIGTGIHETDKSTIYGSLNHIFNTLQETFTNAKIICITQPSFWSLVKSDITTDAQAQELGFDNLAELQVMSDVQFSNFSQAMKEEAVKNIAWAYGIHVCDMFHDFPPVSNPVNRTTYWQNDKLHLTTAGYNLVASGLDKSIVDVFGKGIA